ncbi:MAG: hypothetical protein AAB447_00225 [Patescibacteria group bacterium]
MKNQSGDGEVEFVGSDRSDTPSIADTLNHHEAVVRESDNLKPITGGRFFDHHNRIEHQFSRLDFQGIFDASAGDVDDFGQPDEVFPEASGKVDEVCDLHQCFPQLGFLGQFLESQTVDLD